MTHDPLTPFDIGRPTPEAVRLLRKELYTNARRGNKTTLGGGRHGHLGLVMPEAEYILLSHGGVTYDMPAQPVRPVLAGVAAARDEQTLEYKVTMKIYSDAVNMTEYLMHLIIQAVPKTYIARLQDRVHGFADVSPAQLLKHLMDKYGKISPKDMEANADNLARPWNPDTAIETLFDHGNDCCNFAIEGNDAITDSAYVRAIVRVIKKSGVLDDAVKDWGKYDEADQTVEAMEDHFTKADATRIAEQAELKGVLSANTAATNQGLEYCWSHGICDHPSAKCTKPADGHKKEATLANLCGGCTWFQRPSTYEAVFKNPNPSQKNRNRERNSSNTDSTADKEKDKEKDKRNKEHAEKRRLTAAAKEAAKEAAMAKSITDAVDNGIATGVSRALAARSYEA